MAIEVDCPSCRNGEYEYCRCGHTGTVTVMCDAHPADMAVEMNRDGIGMCQECADDADAFHNPHNAAHQHLWVEAQPVTKPQWCKTCTGRLGEGRRPTFGVICAGCDYRECSLCQAECEGVSDAWGEDSHAA